MILKPSIKGLKTIFQRQIVGFSFCYIVLVHLVRIDNWYDFLPVLLCAVFFLEVVPTILCTWPYYKFNKNNIFELQNDSIRVQSGTTSREYHRVEIEKINVYMSVNNPRFHMAIMVMDFFHFAEIVMKNGDSVVITSICHHQVDEVLEEIYPDVPMEYKWGGGSIKRLRAKSK